MLLKAYIIVQNRCEYRNVVFYEKHRKILREPGFIYKITYQRHI